MPRNYYRYRLFDGHFIVQYGITNDPERREEEHRDERKSFSRLDVVGPAVTKKVAEEWEAYKLDSYRAAPGGHNPRYHKTER